MRKSKARGGCASRVGNVLILLLAVAMFALTTINAIRNPNPHMVFFALLCLALTAVQVYGLVRSSKEVEDDEWADNEGDSTTDTTDTSSLINNAERGEFHLDQVPSWRNPSENAREEEGDEE